MATILVLYSSVDGHTIEICHRLKAVIEQRANQVTLVSVQDYRRFDLNGFDKIILGASIRYGKHSTLVYDFVARNLRLLASKPTAFFSVNLVARKAHKNQPESNPYLRKFLHQTTWRPKLVAVFAGKLDYPKYGFADRLIIRLIMWVTQGPTAPGAVVDFTDWKKVEEFGRLIGEM